MYGRSTYGWFPYGVSNSLLYIEKVVVTSTREIDVFFSKPIEATSPVRDSDALNPETWTVTRGATELTILNVTLVSEKRVRLFFMEQLGSCLEEHNVNAEYVHDTSNNYLSGWYCDEPYEMTFVGCTASAQALEKSELVDFSSLPFDADRPANTLHVASGGDYLMHGGQEFWRKLVIRRLSTLPGGYFHLPEYGIGLRVKEPLSPTDLVVMRAEIQRELLREPEFSEVSSRLQLFSDGTLTVEVRISLKQGKIVNVSVDAQPVVL